MENEKPKKKVYVHDLREKNPQRYERLLTYGKEYSKKRIAEEHKKREKDLLKKRREEIKNGR